VVCAEHSRKGLQDGPVLGFGLIQPSLSVQGACKVISASQGSGLIDAQHSSKSLHDGPVLGFGFIQLPLSAQSVCQTNPTAPSARMIAAIVLFIRQDNLAPSIFGESVALLGIGNRGQ
jgi:hypothetical protein